ncbi:hypothetical protein RMATCC62417_18416 [Rhizopus microsporus]|nr:hypothetical protein RMATCC62417_18416 [Rhizopus microsporus]
MTTLPSNNSHSNDSNQSSPYTSEISLTTNTSSSSGPPIPPPHLENVQFYTPAPTIRQNQMANKDFDYLPSSSIDMATEASKRRSERINSNNPKILHVGYSLLVIYYTLQATWLQTRSIPNEQSN